MLNRGRSSKVIAVSAIAFIVTNSVHTPKSWALLQDSPKGLVDQAWQIVQREYVERSFNHNDWQGVRREYLERSYSSKQQAYQAIQEMLGKLADPYTEFLEPQEIKELVSNTSGDFIGVGLTVALDQQTKHWIVVAAIQGSPAAASGILPEDVILKVNDKSTPEIDPQQASSYLIGPVGSQVLLRVGRGNQQLNFKLVREQIDLNPVTYRAEATPAGKIGRIRLPVFTSQSPQQMRQAIQALEKQQVKGYILDLRSNPGGIFEASLEIARLWLSKGTIASIVDRAGKDRFTAKNNALTDKPLAVLIDNKSASASEVLAGALQDNRRATLVGTQTFGKGLVQSLAPLKDGSGVKVTVAKYYTPKDQDIHKVGIKPDIAVQLPEAQAGLRAGATSDPQYARALAHLIQSISGRSRVPKG